MYEVIEMEGKRVLTTAQVAESYGVETKSLQRNYQRNKERFEEGLHFIKLKGEELKAFKAGRQNDAQLKYATKIYFWTEEGAFLLAKSVSSDAGWAAYRLLVTSYYKASLALQKSAAPLALPFDEERYLALETRVKEIEQQLQFVTLHTGEQKRLQKAISMRVYDLCQAKARRPAFFSELYRAIKNRYSVDSYRDVPQCKLQDALYFVESWGGERS